MRPLLRHPTATHTSQALRAGCLLVCLLAASCDGDGTAPVVPLAVTLSPASGDLEVGDSIRFIAHVDDVESTAVLWRSNAPAVARVDADGMVTAASPGEATITAVLIEDTTARADAVVFVSAAPAGLRLVAGGDQLAAAGSPLDSLITVRVLGPGGEPLAAKPVTWSVEAGGGSVTPLSEVTGDDGRVHAVWTLGPHAVPQRLVARASGGDPVLVRAHATMADEVFVVGDRARLVRFDGAAWSSDTLTVPWNPYWLFTDVWGASANDVYAVGWYTKTAEEPLILHYDGAGWTRQPPRVGGWARAVHGTSGSNVFVVGQPTNEGAGFHFDGTSWTPIAFWKNAWIAAVSGRSADDVYALARLPRLPGPLSGSGTEILRFDGSSWSSVRLDTDLEAIWAAPGTPAYAVGEGGTILRERPDGGWEPMSGGTATTLNAVWGTGEDDVFVVGSGGTILHYDGTSWSEMASGTVSRLEDVWGSSGDDVFAVGDGGTILHYDGTAWSAMNSGSGEWLRGVSGTSSQDVYVVGSRVILHWDGVEWRPMSGAGDRYLFDVWARSPSEVHAVGWNDILTFDGTEWRESPHPLTDGSLGSVWGTDGAIIASGGAGTLMLDDGSGWRVWRRGVTEVLQGVWASETKTIAVGGSQAWSFDGAEWSLMALPADDLSLSEVWGSSPTDVFAVGGGGTILHYDGSAWRSMESGTAAHLRGIGGSAPNDVFAVGSDGVILHYDGATWTSMPSGTEETLTGVVALSPTDVFAVGGSRKPPPGGSYEHSGVILHFDGESWIRAREEPLSALRAVWAVGRSH